MQHNKILGLKVENKDKEGIENSSPCSPLFKWGIRYLSSIFDNHNSWLWDYVLDTQDSCCFALVNYKKVCLVIQENFGYQSEQWQIAIIIDIMYGKKAIMISIETMADKNLI